MQVTLPGGTVVQATGLSRPDNDPPPDYGFYVDDAWTAEWPHEIVDWPDYGIPDDEPGVFSLIESLWERAQRGEMVEIGCAAGVGRTGTVLACLAVLAGVPGDDAVRWVRANFRGAAVETREQQEMIGRFAAAMTPAA